MARQIVLHWRGNDIAFDFAAVDRDKLYGKRKRVPLDAAGNPCTRASLFADGSIVVRAGMTAQSYFDAKGNPLSKGDLTAVDADGVVLSKLESSLGAPQDAVEVSPTELLDHEIAKVYALDADPPPELRKRLEDGAILRFAFNYTASVRADVGFLLATADGGLFALIGTPLAPQWVEHTTPPPVPVEAPDDDLDFDMF